MVDERGPAPGVLGALGEPVYRVVVRARNRGFDRGSRVRRMGVPVISVGNLSVGGTGKTPLVMMVVELLRREGLTPAIAMRGYKSAGGMSDEEAEYRDRLGEGVPIVARPDRASGIEALLRARGNVDCVVLDDGFQHRFVGRDLDMVLVDATRDPFADRCLPRGWLREPVESLGRADVVVVTRVESVGEEAVETIERGVRRVSGALVVRASHGWEGVEGAGDAMESVEWLRGRRVVVACAIGNGEAFVGQVERAGAEAAARVVERDHHRWTGADVERLREVIERVGGIEAVVTTGKDWVKLRELDVGRLGVPLVRPRVRMAILRGGEELRGMVVTAARGEPAG